MVLMRNKTFGREFIEALVAARGRTFIGQELHILIAIVPAPTMHPSTLRVLKQCTLLDQHTDHIGEGSTNSGDALRCKSKGLVAITGDAQLALEWEAAKLKFDLSAALLLGHLPQNY